MAKRAGGANKSAAIRDYLSGNAAAKPKEIVAHLKTQGLNVTPAFVSTIKSKLLSSGEISADGSIVVPAPTKRRGRPKGALGKKKPLRTAAPAAAPASVKEGAAVSIEGLVLAKKLADQLGGVANARAVLAALEKITG